jgi:hypothetical protein
MTLVILTGASGSGKTTIAERLEQQHPELVRVFRFDSIGVPSPEERIAGWGSGGGWQRAMRIAKERDLLPGKIEDIRTCCRGGHSRTGEVDETKST